MKNEKIKLKDIEINNYIDKNFLKNEKKDYNEIKKKYGPVAQTDSDFFKKSKKDARFNLHYILKESLMVHEEEKRAIEQIVQKKIQKFIEEEKENIKSQAYQEGFEKGYDSGWKKFSQENNLLLVQFKELMNSIDNLKNEIFLHNEKFIFFIMNKVLKKIFLKEVSLDEDYIIRVLKDLIEKTNIKNDLKILISDEDFRLIERIKNGLGQSLFEKNNIEIEVSKEISSGSCRLICSWGFIQSSIDEKIENIFKSFIGPTE